jgi:hypothetical protein
MVPKPRALLVERAMVIYYAMTDPTPLVQSHIERLFHPGEWGEVAQPLREDCGKALPCTTNASPEFFERVQCAALKLSEGRIDKLYDAIALA